MLWRRTCSCWYPRRRGPCFRTYRMSSEDSKRDAKLSIIAQRRRERIATNRRHSLAIRKPGKRRSGVEEQEQENSPLFSLPLELRMEIYEMVICETGVLHVRFAGWYKDRFKLISYSCVKGQGVHDARACDIPYGRSARRVRGPGRLGLLQTCRRMSGSTYEPSAMACTKRRQIQGGGEHPLFRAHSHLPKLCRAQDVFAKYITAAPNADPSCGDSVHWE